MPLAAPNAAQSRKESILRVAINGIGVGGPTLAYWLKRYGHEAVMFEKAPALRTGGYIIDFWGLGYEIAERMGLLPTLSANAYRMERLRMVDADGAEVAHLEVSTMRDLLDGRFISLARADLATALFGACEGVSSRFGVSISQIDARDDGVFVTLSDGGRERFDLVVGADGLHSKVRELSFGPEERYETSLGCHVAAFRIPHYPVREELAYVSHTVPKRQVARVALRDDETLILLVCRSDLIPGDVPPAQHSRALRAAFGDMKWEVPDILERMAGVEEIYFDRVSQIHMDRWSSRRVALIGDAAACASLLAGEGTGLAMTEAYVLAGELHRASGDIEGATAEYEAKLRAFVAAKQRGALRLRSFFAPRSRLSLWMRNLGVNALSHPSLAKFLVKRSLHDAFTLPDYEAS